MHIKPRIMKYHLVFIAILLLSCSKKKNECNDPSNPDCINYDKCYGKSPVTADFMIGQIAGANIDPNSTTIGKLFIEDSIFPVNCSIKFKAKIEGAKYTWLLGSETLYTNEFARIFDENTPTGKYSVKLIIEKSPDKVCFPKDDGKDTITKYFYIVNPCLLKTTGWYKGIWEGVKMDSMKIGLIRLNRIYTPKTRDTCQKIGYVLINLQNTADTADWLFPYTQMTTNYQAHFGGSGNGDNLKGSLIIDKLTQKVIFDYIYFGVKRKFIGRKI